MNLKTENWHLVKDMPISLWGHCAAKVEDSVIITGGWDSASSSKDGMRTTLQFHLQTKRWKWLTPMTEGNFR